MLYCIDSHAFIWAVKKQAEDHDKHMIEEAQTLMDWMDKSKHQLVVPTIVLAECLIREAEKNHPLILAEAYRKFIVADFDSRCALKYGELLRLEKWVAAKDAMKVNGIRREKMKLDHMIIATALVNGANGIFSKDEGLQLFAKDIIHVYPPKIIAKQGALPLQ